MSGAETETLAGDDPAALIARAHALAEGGDIAAAVRAFDAARRAALAAASAGRLRARIIDEEARLAAEAARMDALLRADAAHDAARRLFLVGDSLGLPRPGETDDFDAAVGRTYAGLAREGLRARGPASVAAHFQRFFTTDHARAILERRAGELTGAQVVIHLGLNDCAARMFRPEQRLAIGLLDREVADALIGFARARREAIIRLLPELQYVPLPRFRENLAAIAAGVRAAGAAGLTVATAIVPPTRFWRATPGVCRRFTAYNLAIMELAESAGFRVLDIDRAVWETGWERLLDADGMHLSPTGHRHLAAMLVNRLFPA